MPTFPRVGVELSSEAAINFTKPVASGSPVYERPGLIVGFANGFKERRAEGGAGRFESLSAHFTVNEVDFGVIFDFLQARDLFVEPFTLEHPYLGTATVNYNGCDGGPPTKFSPAIILGGSPAWYEFEITFEGRF